MCLRASDPAGHHGWVDGGCAVGGGPVFRGDPPISGPTGAGPVSGGGKELRKFVQIPNPQLPPLPATMTLPIRPRVGTCPGEWWLK